jgi:predicted ATPase with chaperone activity
MSPDILQQIGPAVSSGNSFLIYGQPGNGKTFLAEALSGLDTQPIYLPYAIEAQGAIIQIYDQVFHQAQHDQEEPSVLAVSASPGWDRRWFKCRRPFIVSGGELTLDMLDLSYNPVSKIYDAPLQLKANNGIYLIDDFGRQRCTPAEVLNRWIVPMERRIDYLTLQTGGKIMVPFDAFLVFSTNLRPDQLGDEAFLRRIQYKMHLRNPKEGEFIDIFKRFCEARELECPVGLPEWFVDTYYKNTGKRMRRCHPRDALSHALDLIHFEKLPRRLTAELLDHAFRSCFVEVGDMEA